MSYLVLARKYRPMTFDELVGQEHVATTLSNAIQMDRLANAYLFSGPRGIGKTTVARILARAINCDNGPTPTPCNHCSYCKEITDGRSLEVQEIDGASNRGIDEIRNLRESLRYAPTIGKYKIYIIDEVHMLTPEAFNALLKTLEEPPKNVLFIFATTEPNKVPATILSRCQRFDFRRIRTIDISQQLKNICQNENIDIDNESLRIISEKADGGMRDALSLLDQVVSFSGMTIRSNDILAILGIIHHDLFFDVSTAITTGAVARGIEIAQRLFTEGLDAEEFLNGLAEHFRNFLVAQSTRSPEHLRVSEEHANRYLREASSFSAEDLLRYIKIVSETAYSIRRSENPALHLEITLTKLIKLDKSITLNDLMLQLGGLKKKPDIQPVSLTDNFRPQPLPEVVHIIKPADVPVPGAARQSENRLSEPVSPARKPPASKIAAAPPADTTVSAKAVAPIEISTIENRWVEIIDEVKKRKIALGSFLSEGWPTKIKDNILEITFSKNNGFHIDSVEKNKKMIQAIISQLLGINLRIVCKKDEHGILEQTRKVEFFVDKTKAFERLMNENPLIKSMVARFDAELIK